MKITTLYDRHQQLGARMGEFGGWDMPIQYVGILQEHQQTRARASVFDIGHMSEFQLSGPDVEAELEFLLTCRVGTLEVGQVRYGFMLNDDGGTMDDLTVYRMEPDRFMLVVNAGTAEKDAAWIREHISDDTCFTDLSSRLGKLDVQGPDSRAVLKSILGEKLPDMGYFRFEELSNGWIISRTGYTGEWGYEIYLPIEDCGELWDQLIAHENCEPGGLGARNTLRLEMGYSLYGHELSEARTPVPVSKGMFICMDKKFIGKENVEADLADPEYLLVGVRFKSKHAAHAMDKIYYQNIEVGQITSGSMAPSLNVAVAMALVEPEFAEIGRILNVEIRGKRYSSDVVELPFYTEGSARG